MLFFGGDTTENPQENHVGVYAPSIFSRKRGLKLVNILNLAKRIV